MGSGPLDALPQQARALIDGLLPSSVASATESIETPTYLGLVFSILVLLVGNVYLMLKGELAFL